MSYLYDGETHDNYDPAFMAELGMSDEVVETAQEALSNQDKDKKESNKQDTKRKRLDKK